MINDWRSCWGQGDFPFLIVQLANFMKPVQQPQESSWALLREAQAQTAAGVSNAGLAVAIDIGEADDIPPRNKQDVGKRLAMVAQKIAYKENIVYSGPVFKNIRVKGDKAIISFDNTGSGLISWSGELTHFAIAGNDKKFVWAQTRIEGDTVIVSSPLVKDPIAVRYAWADNPEGCNLYNKEGLPAVPFRTDKW